MQYVFTKEILAEKFRSYNEQFFAGELVMPRFRIGRGARLLGSYGRGVLTVSAYWDVPEDEINKVLLHEMIHVWQEQTLGKADHGRSFKLKAAEINAVTGYDISRLSSRTGYKPAMKPRKKSVRKGVSRKKVLLKFTFGGKTYKIEVT